VVGRALARWRADSWTLVEGAEARQVKTALMLGCEFQVRRSRATKDREASYSGAVIGFPVKGSADKLAAGRPWKRVYFKPKSGRPFFAYKNGRRVDAADLVRLDADGSCWVV
jgi:hypothetical protein